tara:strand:- start:3896 stop:4090 length:195 start_codon:yes stop_codon:yes gene_type:complete
MDLAAYLDDEKITAAEFSRRLGVSHVAVHHWVTGARRPNARHTLAIEELTEGRVTARDLALAAL